jgi:hypothetical protein
LGDTDLSSGGSPPAGPTPVSLPDLIRAGDAGAFAGFRRAPIGMVRAYCEVACAPELVTDAREAAFLDFVGRLSAAGPGEQAPEAMLLAATRSAAASRFAAPALDASEGTDATGPRGISRGRRTRPGAHKRSPLRRAEETQPS